MTTPIYDERTGEMAPEMTASLAPGSLRTRLEALIRDREHRIAQARADLVTARESLARLDALKYSTTLEADIDQILDVVRHQY